MSHVRLWLAGGVVVLVLGVLGLSALTAQRMPPGFGGSEIGRYVVAHVGPEGIILLDTATGELYKAGPNDIKPHAARARGDRGIIIDRDPRDRERFADKEAIDDPRFDKRADKDKGRPDDKARDKDGVEDKARDKRGDDKK